MLDKTCHTVPMILTANSCLSILFYGSILLISSVFSLHNDLHQVHYQTFWCILRGYLGYPACGILQYSFLLQAVYRYFRVVHSKCLFWQSIQVYIFLICISWVFSFAHTLIFIINDQIVYNADNQICQIPLTFSFYLIDAGLFNYTIPVTMIMFIYFKLARYVRVISQHMTPVRTLSQARRELKIVQRTVTIIAILFTLGFPYFVFMLISFVADPPKYHFRIAFVFVDGSLALVMIAIFRYTKPLQVSVRKRLSMQEHMATTKLRRWKTQA